MLVEPPGDARLLELDRAVVEAVTARMQGGVRTGPDADAIALRSLLGPNVAPSARAAVRAVLGRIDAATGDAITACGPLAGLLAADRYGTVQGMVADPDAALNEVRAGGRALIDMASARPWWGRLLAMPDLQVVAALPDDLAARPQALMVSRALTGPTGNDRTFWVTDSPASQAGIVQALSGAGLVATMVHAAGGLKLFALAGYVQVEDGRLAMAPGTLKGVIGAAPVF
ncbi:hypothetical protein [Brevundimonas variabilis]|uniref:Uncharacterized protein n=1 Tax=Brevundimonas variabilis TaxID=74312 RepID=A0A7W9FD71_9CAUL|nr:hypothetical protein [Brevundimonas variabilis]MBB5745136.1 hypothetical protein [Brevundimonas variabilis]